MSCMTGISFTSCSIRNSTELDESSAIYIILGDMMTKFLDDFKAFAIKGNAIDMAIGIVVGAAFNKIINSMVADIIMPPLGLAIGGVDFKNLELVLKQSALDTSTGVAVMAPAVALRYGMFLNSLVEFFIVAFSAFLAVKVMAKTMAARQDA